MPASAFLLAFAAAWIHGVSNVFVGRRQEPEAAFAFMLVVGVIAFAPIAVLTWDVDAAAIPYIAASAALELGYFAFLAAGYRMSEVSLVYPVARGAAPILVLAGAVLFLHHGTTAGQVAGVIAVGVGIVLVRGVGAMARRADANGFLFALAAGTFIAGYTLVDKQGLHHAAPIPYIELVLIGPACSTRSRSGASAARGVPARGDAGASGSSASSSSAPTSSSSSRSGSHRRRACRRCGRRAS